MQARNRTWLAGWNFGAFLHSTGWFWYRRMYAWSLLNLIAPLIYVLFITLVLRPLLPDERMGYAVAATGIVYLLIVFVLVPVFADSLYLGPYFKEGKAPKPPSAFTAIGALVLVVVPAYMAWVTVQAQLEYARRDRASEGLWRAMEMRAPLAEFHANQGRLPGPQEAAQFRERDAMRFTSSVAWDAERRAIVITLGEQDGGKRYEVAAVEKDGKLEWVCRTIDLDPKYLRSSCR
jgi:hypothetical protein